MKPFVGKPMNGVFELSGFRFEWCTELYVCLMKR